MIVEVVILFVIMACILSAEWVIKYFAKRSLKNETVEM